MDIARIGHYGANESASDLVADSVTDLVARLLLTLGPRSLRISDLMAEMSLVHKATFRSNYLKPALTAGMIEMTDPQSPKSPTQKYRLTQLGKMMVKKLKC
jgi:DNA-binding HxlR family transcriptional regulator